MIFSISCPDKYLGGSTITQHTKFRLNFWYTKSPHLVYNVCEVCNNFVFSMLHIDNFTVHDSIEGYFGHVIDDVWHTACTMPTSN